MQDDLLLVPQETNDDEGYAGDSPDKLAIASIKALILSGYPLQVQFSGGKDSSCCANLVMAAAKQVIEAGEHCPPIFICTADTGVENPVVRSLADHELAKMKVFANTHGLPVKIMVGKPTLGSTYATRVIGGRALPPFPVGKRDCTTDWKIAPSQRVSRKVREYTKDCTKPLVTVIGTRSAESAARLINTAKRGETDSCIWYGPEGDARLSPILRWTTDDVWTYLGECAAGVHESYSDFADLITFYSAAAGGECVVVADMRQGQGSPCGARSGCWVCGAVQNDTSVENMIRMDPKQYGYLEPLLRFRNYVVNTQWDWSLRNFLGRTIDKDGFMAVKADQFSPEMCERLLRYMLTAQDKANAMGAPSRVQAIGMKELIAIDFFWSVRAWHPPFHALKIFEEHCRGKRMEAPLVEQPVKPSPVPDLGKIFVGVDWDDECSALAPQGMRDPAWEMFSDSCGPSLRVGRNGKTFLSLDESIEFDVDEESAVMFMDFEAERHLNELHRLDSDWTEAARVYLRYGVVTLASGQSSGIDNMIRRSQWLQRHQLHGHQTADQLRQKCEPSKVPQQSLFA